MIIILTGGIASGKSEVSKHLASKGFEVVDGDIVSRELQSDDKDIRGRIAKELGAEFVTTDGIDRKALREAAFSDPNKLAVLNDIMLAGIYRRMQKRLDTFTEKDAVFVVPLWFDTPHRLTGYDEVWTVTAPAETRLERIVVRDASKRALAESMIKSQINDAARISGSDRVIDNSGTTEDLFRRVDKALEAARRN